MKYIATFDTVPDTEQFAKAIDDPNAKVDLEQQRVEFEFPYWMEIELRSKIQWVYEGRVEAVRQ